MVRSSLTLEAAKTLVHAFVSSRLDYCNSLLYEISDGQLTKRQTVQNATARVVTGTRKFDHITLLLHQLHWLPVRHQHRAVCARLSCFFLSSPTAKKNVWNDFNTVHTMLSCSYDEVTCKKVTFGVPIIKNNVWRLKTTETWISGRDSAGIKHFKPNLINIRITW